MPAADHPDSEGIRTRPRPDRYLCNVPGIPLYRGLRDRLFEAAGIWSQEQCPNSDCRLILLDGAPIASVDTSKPAIRGQAKTGHRSGRSRPDVL